MLVETQGLKLTDLNIINVFLEADRAAIRDKVNEIIEYLEKINADMEIDLVVVDSLDLLSPETRRSTNREELNDILASAKHMAVSFNSGKGLRLISPWQTSREAYKRAQETGSYDKTSLAETSEAERKADLILGLIEKDGHSRLKAQVLKFRDGAGKEFEININYDKCFTGTEEGYNLTLENTIEGITVYE